ncbi:hypothetical protein [Providencia stuartii]|uniref:hypothetical protein n=1 Tax=Providencia stuartii TaxID=588 RepID=UPI0013D010C7|nr:hypothetical protein [Providencia stuartii]
MLNLKRHIRIEIYEDKKVIEIKGYTEKEAQRLIVAYHSSQFFRDHSRQEKQK